MSDVKVAIMMCKALKVNIEASFQSGLTWVPFDTCNGLLGNMFCVVNIEIFSQSRN